MEWLIEKFMRNVYFALSRLTENLCPLLTPHSTMQHPPIPHRPHHPNLPPLHPPQPIPPISHQLNTIQATRRIRRILRLERILRSHMIRHRMRSHERRVRAFVERDARVADDMRGYEGGETLEERCNLVVELGDMMRMEGGEESYWRC
jgi:hypothetical protein